MPYEMIMAILSVTRPIHQYSYVFILVIAFGILNTLICIHCWLKRTFGLCIINFTDLATWPTFILNLTFGVLVAELGQCSLKSSICQTLFGFYIIVSSFIAYFTRSRSVLCSGDIYADNQYYKGKLCDIENFIRIQMNTPPQHADILCRYYHPLTPTMAEYIFIYFPCIVLKMGEIKNILVKTVSWKQTSNDVMRTNHCDMGCISCNNSIKLFNIIVIFVLFSVIVLRPMIVVANLYFGFMTKDIIPCITLSFVTMFIIDRVL